MTTKHVMFATAGFLLFFALIAAPQAQAGVSGPGHTSRTWLIAFNGQLAASGVEAVQYTGPHPGHPFVGVRRRPCRGRIWVPGHYNRYRRWIPAHFRHRHWIPGHYNRYRRWVPGHCR